VPLKDDRAYFPPYDTTMQRLNYEVERKRTSPAAAAGKLLEAKGLIPGAAAEAGPG